MNGDQFDDTDMTDEEFWSDVDEWVPVLIVKSRFEYEMALTQSLTFSTGTATFTMTERPFQTSIYSEDEVKTGDTLVGASPHPLTFGGHMPSRPAKPCLTCGTPCLGARCPPCEATRQSARNATRLHYRGDYDRRARAVRDAANADPLARCWLCGDLARAGDPWQADHMDAGNADSALAAAHRSCNAARGNRAIRNV